MVIKGEGGKLADCPNVFLHNGKWYMMYVSNPGQGYETYLAVSDDLLKWTPLGKFDMYSNGKRADGSERIGMAVSKNMTRWTRYGSDPVIDNASGNSGDPQITRIGDVWVMIYYGAFWKPKAFDTFACSYDMVTWTKWTGPHLVEPSVPFDNEFAHKPWMVFHNGVVYHFYCASGDQGRVIAVATSREINQ